MTDEDKVIGLLSSLGVQFDEKYWNPHYGWFEYSVINQDGDTWVEVTFRFTPEGKFYGIAGTE